MGLHVSKHIHGNKETAYSFLSKHTFGDALGGVTTPMIVIPASFTVEKALVTLNGGEGRKPVLSAPVVLDAFHTDMGLVDVMDLSQWLAKFAVFLRSNDLQHFNEAFFESNIQPVVGVHASDRVLPFEMSSPLSEVASGMLRVGTHRAVALKSLTDSQSPIVALLSQTQMLCFFADNLSIFEKHPETTLGSLPPKRLVTMSPKEPAINAFEKLIAQGVSAIAVVDENGVLINSVSASNVRLLTKENAPMLLLPVTEWLDKMGIKQSNNARVSATIKTAIETIRDNHLHRIWIVDEGNKLVSVLTVGDILRRFSDQANKEAQ